MQSVIIIVFTWYTSQVGKSELCVGHLPMKISFSFWMYQVLRQLSIPGKVMWGRKLLFLQGVGNRRFVWHVGFNFREKRTSEIERESYFLTDSVSL